MDFQDKDKTEYPETRNKELSYYQQRFLKLPRMIIENFNIGDQRLAVYTYLAIRCGLDYKVDTDLKTIILSFGKKPDRHPGQINDKTENSLSKLIELGYIKKLSQDCDLNVNQTFFFDQEWIDNNCPQFTIAYIDEIERILSSDISNKDITLLVFAYLRLKIHRRPNSMPKKYWGNQEGYKADNPEVYNCYYRDIAKELGLTVHVVQKAVDALIEIGLIYAEELPRHLVKSSNGQERWMTGQTLFCNTYKRDAKYEFVKGKQYYEKEIKNKKKIIEQAKGGNSI